MLQFKPDLLPLFSTEVKNAWTIPPLLYSASWCSLSRGWEIYLDLSESITVIIIWKQKDPNNIMLYNTDFLHGV
jgi:hypothetical protein